MSRKCCEYCDGLPRGVESVVNTMTGWCGVERDRDVTRGYTSGKISASKLGQNSSNMMAFRINHIPVSPRPRGVIYIREAIYIYIQVGVAWGGAGQGGA